ncbi:hypothetical protein A5747_13690 [Mycobacterium sp. IS-836]|uniref:hypothetical protein n=1 Tax=Mycobacterium sp. IS-836 TaxID=1834160 RepID=UPI00096F7601|nr:hypothetical protein [Mycobacterium sp. IS-836]OMC55436.1 hypothetical protein A5747_13690 [Mycobacterium sp. IS-836]
MTVRVTNQYYPEYDERERHVAGDRSSAAIFDDNHTLLTIGGMPEIDLDPYRLRDLRDVLDAALTLVIDDGAFLTEATN